MRVYVGLGANLGDPVRTLRSALRALDRLPATQCRQHSRLYLNPPVGPQDQAWYVNAVAELETRLAPRPLLDWLLELERRHGRVRGRRWGPRTLDLDLLLYGDLRLRTGRLILPHPRLHQRAFVVQPLTEIAPNLMVPGRGPLRYWHSYRSSKALQVIATT